MMNKMCCVIIAWQSLAMLHLFSLLQPRPWCTHQSHSSGLKHSFPWVSGVLSAESLSENRRGRWEAHPTLCPFTEPLIAVDAGTPQDGPRLLFQLHSVQLLQVTWPAFRVVCDRTPSETQWLLPEDNNLKHLQTFKKTKLMPVLDQGQQLGSSAALTSHI